MTSLNTTMEMIKVVAEWMFVTGTPGDESRIINYECEQSWPFLPVKACNPGFLLSNNGLSISYICDHITYAAQHKRSLWATRLDKGLGYENACFEVLCDTDRKPINGGFKDAAFLKMYDIYQHKITNFPKIRRDFPKSGEKVFSLASNCGMWTLSHGEIHSRERYGENDILIKMDAYHGYCGSPLFDEECNLLGFGASIFFEENRDSDLTTRRAYGFCRYTHLATIINAVIPDLQSADGVKYTT